MPDEAPLADLFAMDPLKLAQDPASRARVIAHLRENRERYVQGVKTPKLKAEKAPRPERKLNLSDLGL